MTLINEFKISPDDCKVGLSSVNYNKNRFANIIPPDNFRVKLGELAGIAGSDYINASYVDGIDPTSPKQYIATQVCLNLFSR